MIVGDLLLKLTENGTKLILTSNAHPNDLYKDGLQRQKFQESIDAFLKNITIHELKGETDYRTRNIIQLAKNDDTIYSDEDISTLIKKNFGIDKLESNEVEINHRKFGCKVVSNNILWIEYSSFFNALIILIDTDLLLAIPIIPHIIFFSCSLRFPFALIFLKLKNSPLHLL